MSTLLVWVIFLLGGTAAVAHPGAQCVAPARRREVFLQGVVFGTLTVLVSTPLLLKLWHQSIMAVLAGFCLGLMAAAWPAVKAIGA